MFLKFKKGIPSLGLFGWPPLASHTVAVLVGVMLFHAKPEDLLTLSLPTNSWILSLPRKILNKDRSQWIPVGGAIALDSLSDNCRLTRRKATLIGKLPQVTLRLHKKDAQFILESKTSLDQLHITNTQAPKGKKKDLCQRGPRISYGNGK